MQLTASPAARAQVASSSCSLAAASPFVGAQLRVARQAPRTPRRMAGVSCTAAPEATKTQRPDATGRYGRFGGKYVPETLISALAELEAAYQEALSDPAFLVRRVGLGWGRATWPGLPPRSPHARGWAPTPAPQAELDGLLKDYVGRPSPLYHADRLSEHYRR